MLFLYKSELNLKATSNKIKCRVIVSVAEKGQKPKDHRFRDSNRQCVTSGFKTPNFQMPNIKNRKLVFQPTEFGEQLAMLTPTLTKIITYIWKSDFEVLVEIPCICNIF